MKPVAWMYEVNDTFILFSANKPPEDAYDEGSLVPLYTALKELSDEEIKEVIRKHWNREFGNRGMLELCRAILKKASEK